MNQVGGPVLCAERATGQQRLHYYRASAAGEFLRIAPGHFVDTGVYEELDDDEKEILRIAAHACCAPSCLVVGRSAALVWELPVTDPAAERPTRSVELGTHRGRTRRVGQVRYRTVSRVHVDHRETTDTDYGTLQISDVLTTCLDLARWCSLDDAVRALDHGLHTGQFTVADMDTRVAELKGVTGIADIRRAAGLASVGSESPVETDAKLMLWRLGTPVPVQQVVIRDRLGNRLGRADHFFPDDGVVMEIDGDVKYSLLDPGDNSILLKEYAQSLAYLRNGLRLFRFSPVDLRSGLAREVMEDVFSGSSARGMPYPGHLWTVEGGPAWR